MYEKYCIRLILPACVPFDTSFRKRKENDNNLQQWMLIGWRLKANIVWTYMHYVSQTPSYPSLEYVMHEGVALLPPPHHLTAPHTWVLAVLRLLPLTPPGPQVRREAGSQSGGQHSVLSQSAPHNVPIVFIAGDFQKNLREKLASGILLDR